MSSNAKFVDTLQVTLRAHHMNEKIRRVHLPLHLHLQKIRNYPQIDDATLNKDPYAFTGRIADFSLIVNLEMELLFLSHITL